MEIYRLRQLDSKSQSKNIEIKAIPSTEYKPVHLDTLDITSSLTDQCGHCHRDIKRYIIQAQRVVLDIEYLSRSKFKLIKKRLQEYNLRLDIWSIDYRITNEYLKNIKSLS
jgi:hypothetical protein